MLKNILLILLFSSFVFAEGYPAPPPPSMKTKVYDSDKDGVIDAGAGGAGASNGILKADGAGTVSAATENTDYQGVPAEGNFADGDKTKLDGIAAGADDVNSTTVDAAGAVMNTDYTSTAVDLTGSNPYDIVPTANIRHENLRVSGGDDLNVLTFNETGAFSLKVISVTNVDAALKQRVAHSAGNVEQGGYAVDIYPGQTAYWIYINDRYYYIGGGVTTQTFSSMAIASIAHFANADSIYNDNADAAVVLTDGETKGKIITNCGFTEDSTYTMPAYSFGMNFMVQVCAAYQMDLIPPSGDNIILNGTAAANDEHIINDDDNPGDVMSCWTIESSNGVYDLYCKSDNANWKEAN